MKQTGITKPNQLERIQLLEKTAETLSMGVRVSQMLVQQVGQQLQQLQEQNHIKSSMINDLQYRILALQKVTGVDLEKLQVEADYFKLEEWSKASSEDSAAKKLTEAKSVSSYDSVVVFTTSTPDLKDGGIFRSKIRVSELGSATAMAEFLDKSAGDTFEVILADQKHVVTLLQVLEDNSATTAE